MVAESEEKQLVDITKSFTGMLSEKQIELKSAYRGMIAIATIIILVMFAVYYFRERSLILFSDSKSVDISLQYLFASAPIIFIEIMLVYFFRIILQQYYSVKSQILQIRFKYSICMFIEDHTKFKQNFPNADFKKFDSIIFSPIVAQYGKAPVTFEGVDQFLKFIKSAKRL